MTPKEALKGIKQRINYALHKPENIDTPERQQRRIDKSKKQIDVIEQALNELEVLKKPPTVEEVYKELCEFTKQEVRYSLNTKQFYYRIESTEYTMFITETYGDGLWSLGVYLPPHLITLIGRFYEGLE